MAHKVPDGEGKFCRVTLKRIGWAVRFAGLLSTSTSLRVRAKLKWRKAGHCNRVIFRHYFRGQDQGWAP